MNPHSDPVAHVLSELAKRQAAELEARHDEAVAAAELLRKPFHPKQRAFYCSKHKRKATKKTRRAGATWGGARELMARSLEVAGHRATYVTKTRIEARARAWENDTRSGFLDVLKQEARFIGADGVDTYELGGMRVEVRKADMELNFSNGSQINLFGLKDDASLGKQRGLAKHVYWIDEAQDVPALDRFYKATITPALADFRGEVWLTGTPGIDCAGMFYNVTAEEEDDRLPGWEIHTVAVVDNPYFGHVEASGREWVVVDNLKERHGPYATEAEAEKAATEIRWENTAGVAKRENGWSDDDPDFIREWLGKWVKTDARYVYPVHGVPKHVLVYAPQRLTENPIDRSHAPWLDVDAALLDLPRGPGRDYEWMFSIGADFGYAQTAFALAVWAFTFDRPDIFEVFSWKQHKVLPDDQRQYLELLFRMLPNVVAFVGDPAGQKLADLDAWRTRFNIPIEAADKGAKNTWQELMAGDIRKGNVHYREGSPMLHEATHLVYLPTKPGKTRKDDEFRRIADGSVPGSDAVDAGLYSYRYAQHHLYRDKPKDTRTDAEKQAAEYEEQVRQMGEIARRAKDDLEYGSYGGEYEEW